MPASLRPGHLLDPADVDTLTGKRDREIQATPSADGVPVGVYGDIERLSSEVGQYGRAFDVGLLPLTQISNPFFFSRFGTRGFSRGGFGRARFRSGR
ncbi:MAG TPA: hypothetical protein VHS29_14850 [Candidatus Acidoferrales bacterium]|nr:hypothetical protein [Candidatus Acidoferrales bacterium]